ncbi:SCP2 domain-containing protein [Acidiferrobacter sp.]|uniref:ubiquinone anaerobic biosynthesis accessory factor UbiT n=1 Tax=Acidiferrobacter sp. TaxID=1872107 RepID=UPI00260F112B|nr:SCP2 sterol-binding domain-containing protein [Acidiferrobacter sp.]
MQTANNAAMMTLADRISQAAPRVLDIGARVLPPPAIAVGGALVANILLVSDRSLEPLSGTRICLEITNPRLALGFVIRAGRLWPAPPIPWTTCIRGEMQSFLALLLQTEDADALFFDRRLCVEGDTGVALQLRHALESAIYRHKKRLRALLP